MKPEDKKLAEAIYTKALINHEIISERADTSWQYTNEYDAVIEAMNEYHEVKLKEELIKFVNTKINRGKFASDQGYFSSWDIDKYLKQREP